jgi:hypothetical protein
MELKGIIPPLVHIRDWRREARDYHATACQQGDYLMLTSSLRSVMAAATKKIAVEDLDDMRAARLANHQEVLSQIKGHRRMRIQLEELLREAMSI